MEKIYKPPFRKFVKKQTRPFQLVIEDEVEKVAINPEAGKPKKGDLTGVRVHIFSHNRKKFFSACRLRKTEIAFFMIGPHENFYRELKRYLREVE